MKHPQRSTRKFLLPIGIVVIGVLLAGALAAGRKPPAREHRPPRGALVQVIAAEASDRHLIVEGTGTVKPRHEVALHPQVTGQVVWVHPNMVAGGSFEKDAEMVRIDPADYELGAQRAEGQVAQAEYQLEVARANAKVARREWERLNAEGNRLLGDSTGASATPDPLVRHEPQLRQAEANLQSARAALESARLALDRTRLRAPFNCRIRRQSLSPGTLVGPTSQVAVLYGTDTAEIEVGLPVGDLASIQIPGASARVFLDAGAMEHEWAGRVARTVGVVDELGRLARVVVTVQDPFAASTDGRPELSIGSFVRVRIDGHTVRGTTPIPRAALREGSSVWIATPDSTLQIRSVRVERATPEEILLADGVDPGEWIIVSPLTGAAPGMRVRPVVLEQGR